MRVLFRFCCSLLFAFVYLGSSPGVFSQARVAGIIREIHGPVFWRKTRHSKVSNRLDPRLDQARILYVNEELRVGRGGKARLILCSGPKDIPPTLGWFKVSVSSECPNRSALEAYGRLGGSDRNSFDTPIFSPADHSVVSPDRFVIHWMPGVARCTFTFAIRPRDGKAIWEAERIDGRLGSLDSDQARQAIRKYRADGEIAPLHLVLTDSCGNQSDVTFSLLPEKREAALKEDLGRWDRNSDVLMGHLGRAHVFESYRMFSDVAEECEAALKIAPESRDLMKRTIVAHRETGNSLREEELKKSLGLKTTLP
jgi:hypothetical protein